MNLLFFFSWVFGSHPTMFRAYTDPILRERSQWCLRILWCIGGRTQVSYVQGKTTITLIPLAGSIDQ